MKVMRCLELGKPSREELEAQRRRELAHRSVAQREREAWAKPANPQQPGTLRAGARHPARLACTQLTGACEAVFGCEADTERPMLLPAREHTLMLSGEQTWLKGCCTGVCFSQRCRLAFELPAPCTKFV